VAQVVVGSSPTGHLAIVAELAYARDLNSRFLWVRLPPVAQRAFNFIMKYFTFLLLLDIIFMLNM
jgi:hypothetical protein